MPRRPTSLVSQRSSRQSSALGRVSVPTPARPLPRPRPAAPPVREKRGGSFLGRLLRFGMYLTIWGLVALAGIVIWAAYDLPRPESAMDAERRPALVLQDRAGQTF